MRVQIKNEIIDLSQGAQAVEFLSIAAPMNRRAGDTAQPEMNEGGVLAWKH
jgi:hypothetical protein